MSSHRLKHGNRSVLVSVIFVVHRLCPVATVVEYLSRVRS